MSHEQHQPPDDTLPADLLPLHQRILADSAAWETEQVPPLDRLTEFLRQMPEQHMSPVNNAAVTVNRTDELLFTSSVPSFTQQRRLARLRCGPLPAIAALLLISLAAALFGLMASGHRPSFTANTPTATNHQHNGCAPNQISVHHLQDVALTQIAMVSPDEGWATGIPELDLNSPSLFHYSHCQWQPVPLNPVGVGLTNITMLSAQDGWALGSLPAPASSSHSTTQGLLFHYDGSHWQHVPSPVSLRQGQYIEDFQMYSPHEGWLIVASQEANGSPIIGSQVLYHEVSGVWKAVAMPSQLFPVSVIPFAPADAWIICDLGIERDNLIIYRLGVITPSYAIPASAWDAPIHMNNPQDGWFTIGSIVNNRWFIRMLLHYDGTDWINDTALISDSRIQTAVYVQILSAQEGWAFPASKNAYTVSTSDGAAISFPVIGGALWLHNGRWQSVPWPQQRFTGIVSLAQVSPVEYWAIASYADSGAQGKFSALLHFVNGTWSAYS
jgi:hypothetical protein